MGSQSFMPIVSLKRQFLKTLGRKDKGQALENEAEMTTRESPFKRKTKDVKEVSPHLAPGGSTCMDTLFPRSTFLCSHLPNPTILVVSLKHFKLRPKHRQVITGSEGDGCFWLPKYIHHIDLLSSVLATPLLLASPRPPPQMSSSNGGNSLGHEAASLEREWVPEPRRTQMVLPAGSPLSSPLLSTYWHYPPQWQVTFSMTWLEERASLRVLHCKQQKPPHI